MTFFDEAEWGPIVNDLDYRTRQWAQKNQAGWNLLVEVTRGFLPGKTMLPMRLVVEMARYNARKTGLGIQVSNSHISYLRDLVCIELPEAEQYLMKGKRKAANEDKLSLED